MSYPQPEFREHIDIGNINLENDIGFLFSSENLGRFEATKSALVSYIQDYAFCFEGSSEGGSIGHREKNSYLTKDSIVVNYRLGFTKPIGTGINRDILTHMSISLVSFTTPVDGLAKKLKDLAIETAMKAE